MKRGLRLGVMIVALILPALGVAAPPLDDAHGPRCADFIGSADYRTDASGQATLSVTLGTESGEPTCAGGTYVITAFDSEGTEVGTLTLVGDGVQNVLTGSTTVEGNPSPITITVESFRKGKNPLDAFTSSELFLTGGAGATSFR